MLRQYVQARAPLRLKGVVQRYAWGKVGQLSRIAPFVEKSEARGPLAELWLGAHPKGAADLVVDTGESVSLSSLLVGEYALPFMLKVLSINPEFGLSIQSHPDTETAKILHAKDPEHYPDRAHKPEIGIALSPVSLLYGFKPRAQISKMLEQLPELKPLMGGDSVERIKQIPPGSEEELLKDLFTSLITAPSDEVSRFVASVLQRFDGQADVPAEVADIRKLAPRHGQGDSGLAALCIMNRVTMLPGQAIFIGANTPHAYLDGDLVECMACSDNVIRAGLTTKYKDSVALLETLHYSAGEPALVKAERHASGILAYQTPAREFSIGVVSRGSNGALVDTGDGSGIVLCLGSAASVRHAESGKTCALSDGGAVLLLKGSGRYELTPADADLYVAKGGKLAE